MIRITRVTDITWLTEMTKMTSMNRVTVQVNSSTQLGTRMSFWMDDQDDFNNKVDQDDWYVMTRTTQMTGWND